VDATETTADIVRFGQMRRYGALALDLASLATPGLRALATLRGGTGASAQAPGRALGMSDGERGGVAYAVAELLPKLLIPGALETALATVGHRLRPDRPVMVVDDDEAASALMVVTLQAAGLSEIAVNGGAQALASLSTIEPTALVLDLMMPDVDGFQVLHALRQFPMWRDLPVLVWTAMTLTPEDEAAFRLSAEAIAPKGSLDSVSTVRDAVLAWVVESELEALNSRTAA
jgi:CheY-like chemotaxis protein